MANREIWASANFRIQWSDEVIGSWRALLWEAVHRAALASDANHGTIYVTPIGVFAWSLDNGTLAITAAQAPGEDDCC